MKSLTIGLANDHAQLRQGFASLLISLGHTVLIHAENGLDMLGQLRNSTNIPQVCITDLHMPVMDGFELAKEIKEQFCEMKVIAFSMSSSQPDIKRVLLCGADWFIYKDDFEQLQEVLSSLGNNTFHI